MINVMPKEKVHIYFPPQGLLQHLWLLQDNYIFRNREPCFLDRRIKYIGFDSVSEGGISQPDTVGKSSSLVEYPQTKNGNLLVQIGKPLLIMLTQRKRNTSKTKDGVEGLL